jgi:subfamily B ATP-binding cassette protein MsbA
MAIKKLSRKDLAKMSPKEIFFAALAPYRRLYSYLKPYRGRFYLGIFFGVLYGMTNSLLMLTVKVVSEVVFPDASGKDVSIKIPIFKHLALPHVQHQNLTLTGVMMIASIVPIVMLLRGIFGYLNSYCMIWTSQHVLTDIRQQVFGHMLDQSMGFYNRAKAGSLLQIVFNQTRMAQMALTTVSEDAIKQPMAILSALATLFILDWRFTCATLLLFPVCLIPVAIVGKRVRKSGLKEQDADSGMMVVMSEAFQGIRVVKAYAQETYEKKRFRKTNDRMRGQVIRWQSSLELIGPIIEFLASFGIAAALLYCWLIKLPASTFFALVAGLILLYPPFKVLSRLHVLMQRCLAATTTIFELLDTPPEVADRPGAVELKKTKSDIVFNNVSFGYQVNKQLKPALKNFSFRFEQGKTYALVGESGAGKSTVMSLLLRFYDPDSGGVRMDDLNIKRFTQQSLRRAIGIVNQETFLFHDTIYNNILYGRPNATEAEVYEAARLAWAHDFITEKPEGYQTVIGDKGSLLSGGQQQRLAIARALLKNAPVLLLDEATSALDSESEKQIQLALETLSQGRTVIAIAHRLSTILKADEILVMSNGELIDHGPHAELYGKSPLYQKLYDLQFNHHDAEPAAEIPFAVQTL